MSNKVKKTANKFYKQLKGSITFETVESYLIKIGYKIILFNTPTGDIEVARYRLAEKVQTTNAFTYCGTAKIIFLNNLLSAEDKLYALLHEVAHIILKHLDIERLSAHSSILLDIDADAFVHYLLNPQKSSRKTAVAGLIALGTFTGAFFYNPTTNNMPVANLTAQTDKIVYITSTGTHFHSIECGSITGKATAQIKRDEALRIHTPCSLCNP